MVRVAFVGNVDSFRKTKAILEGICNAKGILNLKLIYGYRDPPRHDVFVNDISVKCQTAATKSVYPVLLVDEGACAFSVGSAFCVSQDHAFITEPKLFIGECSCRGDPLDDAHENSDCYIWNALEQFCNWWSENYHQK